MTLRRDVAFLLLLLAACAGSGPRAPWPAPDEPLAASHAEVKTANRGYRRDEARALVREIARPTRANLDYAAYDANFLIADPPPEQMPGPALAVDPAHAFGDALVPSSLTGSLRATPLTEAERAAPLALAPLAEWLASKNAKLATGLEDLVAAVRAEAWGGQPGPIARQNAVLGYLHKGEGGARELWVKIEFAPWWKGLAKLPDEDGDGVPEIYGRAKDATLAPEALAAIDGEYAGEVLDAAGVARWAHKLASYWYPSYNTDLVTPGPSWPDADTEAEVKASLSEQSFAAPAVIVRGKPTQGRPVYNVFVVAGQGAVAHAQKKAGPARVLSKGKATPAPQANAEAIAKELAASGGSWRTWDKQLAGFHAELKRTLAGTPAAVKGLPGEDGFLFYRNGLSYVTGGDLEKQKRGKNPLPVIVEWKKMLEQKGVDFLFVPVPDKAEIFADKVSRAGSDDKLVGKVVNPYARKLLADLAAAGVETIDLWRPFLEDRRRAPAADEPLFQKQDTHWTPRGLSIAAGAIAGRIAKYPWYRELGGQSQRYREKPAKVSRYGDLHQRLRDTDKKRYQPETLVAQQIVDQSGALYDNDPDSPVVVLGDSFTGVLEETDCGHAGVAAHIAKQIGAPVDLVMSYGGGPNVRHKLMRRGADALGSKRLVVWIMTARDLYDYWEDWEPLAKR